jgi:cytoskeleton protein RodZ
MSPLSDEPKPPEGEEAAPLTAAPKPGVAPEAEIAPELPLESAASAHPNVAPSLAPNVTDDPPRPKHTIGALLRETRENYGGDIERIATALRIRPAYLTALEEGRYDSLPAPVYALGFVRAYAIHMGLDGEEAVRRFKQEASGLEISRDLIFPIPLADRSIPRKPILITAGVLLIMAYVTWYYLSSGSASRPERVSEVPAELMADQPDDSANANANANANAPAQNASPSSAASSAATPASKPLIQAPPPPPVAPQQQAAAAPPQAASPPPPAPAPEQQAASTPAAPANSASGGNDNVFGVVVGSPARIVVTAKSDCWFQVRDSSQNLLFQRLMKPGDVYRAPDKSGLSFFAGNAAALDVAVDGNPVPPLAGTVKHTILLDPARLQAGTAEVN